MMNQHRNMLRQQGGKNNVRDHTFIFAVFRSLCAMMAIVKIY